ncbi:MAG: DNA helicase RecQ [Chitinophagales bacterium]|nr:DNA helicase RecQ [Chitinophagales bacterium]
MITDLHATLHKNFGFREFRPQQEEIIKRILSGKDTVVLMPTGGGKSLCYQLPALVFEGLCIVISPLIALMKDQVENLRSNGIQAAYLNSSLRQDEEKEIRQLLMQKSIKLLYLAPEKIFSPGFLQFLHALDVKLFAVDEAHCISNWGHQFRPEYSQLDILKTEFPETPIVALTATADNAVRSDISDKLNLTNPRTFISSFDRPNLSLSVLPGIKKWEQLVTILERNKLQAGIIYCISRKSTEQLSEKLKKRGFRAEAYHAGLPAEKRHKIQMGFQNDRVQIICATIAFGMGIDKPNIRFVVHYNMPANLESFYQEMGRAGRDGLPAETILFYSYRDVQVQMKFIEDIENRSYKKIRIEKLKRIKEYADAQVCRRKILLSYFNEYLSADCGNCDVCENPPTYLDGSKLAQVALSAIHRVKENATLTVLIDIVRGTRSRDVVQNNFHQIKTFGAGSQISVFAWQLYIQQFIQQGYIAVDYKDHSRLKLTPLSKKVLFEGETVRVVNFDTIKERQEKMRKKPVNVQSFNGDVDEELFDRLKTLRNKIASELGKPAFFVFSNAALKDMSMRKPTNKNSFLEVNGVGEFKAEKFGERFIKLVSDYMNSSNKSEVDLFS